MGIHVVNKSTGAIHDGKQNTCETKKSKCRNFIGNLNKNY